MALSTIRIGVGAGVVAATLLIVGPNPSHAVADKHGPGISSNDDSRQGGSRGPGSLGRAVSDFFNNVLRGGARRSNLNPTHMDIGGAVNDPRNLTVIEDVGPDGPAAMRSAAIAEQPVGDNMAVAAAPAPAASGGGGSGYSGPPVATFNAPRVVIGNGRTPGTQLPTPGPPPVVHAPITAPAPQLAPIAPVPDEVPTVAPPVPLAADINVPPLPPPLPPVEHIGPADFVVAEFGTGTTVTVTDPLAGVAGLILIPAIGAVLGYRQARGAQTLRESLRR